MKSLFPAALCAAVLAAPPARAAAPDRRPTVAVLYFDYDGKDDDLAALRKGLAQMLISDLSGEERLRLVERGRLEEVLAELKLGQSGHIDRRSAAKVGKLLGARYLVLGRYFELMGKLRADASVVEVERGVVLRSVGATGTREDFLTLERTLAEELGAILATRLAPLPAAAQAPPPRPRPRVKPPAKLSLDVAVLYSRALALLDRGQREKAKEALRKVVEAQPDFQLAGLDLDKLMQ